MTSVRPTSVTVVAALWAAATLASCGGGSSWSERHGHAVSDAQARVMNVCVIDPGDSRSCAAAGRALAAAVDEADADGPPTFAGWGGYRNEVAAFARASGAGRATPQGLARLETAWDGVADAVTVR